MSKLILVMATSGFIGWVGSLLLGYWALIITIPLAILIGGIAA